MNRFRLARFETGLRLYEAAERSGIAVSTLSRIEAGQRQPTAPQTKALADLYGKSVAWLLDAEDAAA
jgi:transcriptional regulator with XRE-family HTH domain